jgi:hypothetical protein
LNHEFGPDILSIRSVQDSQEGLIFQAQDDLHVGLAILVGPISSKIRECDWIGLGQGATHDLPEFMKLEDHFHVVLPQGKVVSIILERWSINVM